MPKTWKKSFEKQNDTKNSNCKSKLTYKIYVHYDPECNKIQLRIFWKFFAFEQILKTHFTRQRRNVFIKFIWKLWRIQWTRSRSRF